MKNYVGKLIIHTGSMFSGKTSALLEDLRRFEIAGYKTVLFKPIIDDRYAVDKVKTHNKYGTQLEKEAINIKHIEDIYNYNIKDYDVIGFDEIQFLSSKYDDEEYIKSIHLPAEIAIKYEIEKLLNDFNKTIIIAGLDIDYKGYAFEIVKELLPIADYVYKHHAVCIDCGDDAWISHRVVTDKTDRIALGGMESYIPLCRECYLKRMRGNKNEEQ